MKLNRLVHNIKRFAELGSIGRWIFLTTLILLPVVSLGLKLRGLKRTLYFLGVRSSSKDFPDSWESDDQEIVFCTVLMFRRALQFDPFRSTCLAQALVLWHLLFRQGIMATLCIGVRKDHWFLPLDIDNFAAHSWVEYRGIVLNDRPDIRQFFSAFDAAELAHSWKINSSDRRHRTVAQ